jgi:hypothetical protein
VTGAIAQPLAFDLSPEEIELIFKALAMAASHLDSRASNVKGRDSKAGPETAAKMRTLRSRLGREKAVATRGAAGMWEHPAIHGKHVVSMRREYEGDRALAAAHCMCSWSFRADVIDGGAEKRSAAVDEHWRQVIAQAEAGEEAA